MLPVTSIKAFKVPFPVKRRSVLSAKELTSMKRRAIGLNKLLKHRRKIIPELQNYIVRLKMLQQRVIRCAKRPLMVNARRMVDDYMEMMKPLEDMLIRVILRDEDVKIVRRQQLFRRQKEMVGATINKIRSSCQFHQKWRNCPH